MTRDDEHRRGWFTRDLHIARSMRTALAAFAMSSVGLFTFSTSALAAEPPVPYGSFTAEAENVLGVAVDSSRGDLYVSSLYNYGAPPIYKLTPAGRLISPPSPFGEPFTLGVTLTVNPVNGDVYSLSVFGSLATYDPNSGEIVQSFPVALTPSREGLLEFVGKPPQITSDSAGNVYVPDPYRETSPGSEQYEPNDEVHEYSPEGALLNTFTGGSGEGKLKDPVGVAVDSSGNLWVADGGDDRIEELNPADEPIGGFRSEGVYSVEPYGHEDVLALVRNGEDFCGKIGGQSGECAHLVEYGPTGAKLDDLGAGSFASGSRGIFAMPPLLAVDESINRVYVTDSSNKRIWVFAPPTAPAVVRELTAEVGTSEAKLGAGIDPGGAPTTYRFEYGTTTAYGSSTPSPEGSVGEGFGARTVWAAAGGLAPGSTYHYRVVATNKLGTAYGPDQTFTTPTAAQAACPNEEFRAGFSARLPDCRAYELVTTPTKNSIEAEKGLKAAADGNAMWFSVNDPLPGAPSGNDHEYLATRTAGGWTSQDLRPLESYSEPTCGSRSAEAIFSAQLSKTVIEYGHGTRASEPTSGGLGNGPACNTEGLQVVPGEPVGYQNLLLRDNATDSYRLINASPAGVTPADAFMQGASADLSHVVFSEEAPLTEGAIYGVENLYEWDEGAVRLLTVLPNGTPVQGSLPELVGGDNEISADGSHIVFISGGNLYVRIDGERTVQVDESQGGSGSSGGGEFKVASSDGTEIFFTDGSKLTPDSSAEAGEPDLYECALPQGATKCVLSDLTVAKAPEHADVLSVSPLGAHDSSHVYFAAEGVLASNSREYTDSEGNTVTEKAQAGQRNLYLWSGGTTRFIASGPTTGYEEISGAGQASPDGTWFAFKAEKSLTGYENRPTEGAPAEEIFLYDAAQNRLLCASCDPTGQRPVINGGAELYVGGRFVQRFIFNGGLLYFDTREALVPSDTNGQLDVYEYETGQLHLISSGTSSRESRYIDASESGDDAFFESTQALVPQNTQDGMNAIYDARVRGGFPALASPPACTTADACRTPVSAQPPLYGAPASQTFSGVGNLTPPSHAKPTKKSKRKHACKRLRKKRNRAACRARPGQHSKRKVKSRKGGK